MGAASSRGALVVRLGADGGHKRHSASPCGPRGSIASTSHFDLGAGALATSFVCLLKSFVLGTVIPREHQWRQRIAGLRTNELVHFGAAAFVDLGLRTDSADRGMCVVSYVVSGIGFLGVGVIMKEGVQVRGLNTAATCWASAATESFAGGRRLAEAVRVAAFILAGNTLLRPLVEFVNRRPFGAGGTEPLYGVHLVCLPDTVSKSSDLLCDGLERLDYRIREIENLSKGEDTVELAAVLVHPSANPADLDAIAEHLTRHEGVTSATWPLTTMS